MRGQGWGPFAALVACLAIWAAERRPLRRGHCWSSIRSCGVRGKWRSIAGRTDSHAAVAAEGHVPAAIKAKWTCTGCWSVNFPGTHCDRCGAPRALGADDPTLYEVEELLAEFASIDPEDYFIDGVWDVDGLRDDVMIMRQERGIATPPRITTQTSDHSGSTDLEDASRGKPEQSPTAAMPQPNNENELPSKEETAALMAVTRQTRSQVEAMVLDLRSIRKSLMLASSDKHPVHVDKSDSHLGVDEAARPTATAEFTGNKDTVRMASKLQVNASGGVYFEDAASGSDSVGEKWQGVLLMLEQLEEELAAKK
mmetsp:Transcript_38943/g.77309  ORF Transcript_38943/g.77309 Transcript_38943/m.77309 type:complete len:311 (+) Transcript_38943:28-960(+)|eukprot:CAMPEP_0172710558 /NCGR_PEP_ID=MMETSP1074-20121228/55964_1 /TAXON_ID=2916 /ORGANISM="Ceratium fusus, Strain PA161109" /LENGTH=310 /DNA_ID=CAMNT_0013533989 /DNA_START=23 /DNA_END=955 /DNA_ORIENTATION=+